MPDHARAPRRALLAALASVSWAAAASAAPPEPGETTLAGRTCAFSSVRDLDDPGLQRAVVDGGPLATTRPGVLVCTIVVNTSSHAATGVSVSAHGDTVVVVPPQQVDYRATAADTVDLCTKFVPDDGSPTLYWTRSAGPYRLTGRWSTGPYAVCSRPLGGPPEGPCPVLLALDARLPTSLAETWQDCQGYEPII